MCLMYWVNCFVLVIAFCVDRGDVRGGLGGRSWPTFAALNTRVCSWFVLKWNEFSGVENLYWEDCCLRAELSGRLEIL